MRKRKEKKENVMGPEPRFVHSNTGNAVWVVRRWFSACRSELLKVTAEDEGFDSGNLKTSQLLFSAPCVGPRKGDWVLPG